MTIDREWVLKLLEHYLEKEIGGGSITLTTLPIRTIPERALPFIADSIVARSQQID